MLSWYLRSLSRRHPVAAAMLSAVVLVGGPVVLAIVALGDLRRGFLTRPIALLAVLMLIAIWLAARGARLNRKP